MRLDPSGNLGIGTDNPAAQLAAANNLVIGGTSDADSGMTFVTSTTGQGLIHFSDATSGNARYDGFFGYEQNNRAFKFGTAQQERMRISSTGQLGLGTASPSTVVHVVDADAELTLERTGTHSTSSGPLIQFKGRGPNATIYNFGKIDGVSSGSNNAGHLRFFTNTSGVQYERIRILNDGRVGIGRTDALSTLHVKSQSVSHAGLNSHSIIEDASAMGTNVGGLQVFEGTYITGDASSAAFAAIHGGKENNTSGNYSAYLRFFTRAHGSLPAERLRIDSSGNVKIKMSI